MGATRGAIANSPGHGRVPGDLQPLLPQAEGRETRHHGEHGQVQRGEHHPECRPPLDSGGLLGCPHTKEHKQ